ncbi:MAG TPA: DoxX family protein [Trinickia sp.]|uniref:DoxX family protein n=1 Tax=Trinickia sp. TaxID=2571163 RepID=UPI002F41634A
MKVKIFIEQRKDAFLLTSRVLMIVLFVLFGWRKLTHFSGAVAYMTTTGAPMPELFAMTAIFIEVGVGLALLVGFRTRAFALLLAVYTLGTAVIGHHYWSMSGMTRLENMINFYKNVSIIGGLALLAVSGPGRYSIDRE